jgi:hypothetical protein
VFFDLRSLGFCDEKKKKSRKSPINPSLLSSFTMFPPSDIYSPIVILIIFPLSQSILEWLLNVGYAMQHSMHPRQSPLNHLCALHSTPHSAFAEQGIYFENMQTST